jgi:hypothetical protein
METILIELEGVMDEQNFSIKFFKMDPIGADAKDAKKAKVAMEEARNMMAVSFPSLGNAFYFGLRNSRQFFHLAHLGPA